MIYASIMFIKTYFFYFILEDNWLSVNNKESSVGWACSTVAKTLFRTPHSLLECLELSPCCTSTSSSLVMCTLVTYSR